MTIMNMTGGGKKDVSGAYDETLTIEPFEYVTSSTVTYSGAAGTAVGAYRGISTLKLAFKALYADAGFAVEGTGNPSLSTELAAGRCTITNSVVLTWASNAMSALTTITDPTLISILSNVCKDGDQIQATFNTFIGGVDGAGNLLSLYVDTPTENQVRGINSFFSAVLTYHPDGITVGSKNLLLSLNTTTSADKINLRGVNAISGGVKLRFESYISEMSALNIR